MSDHISNQIQGGVTDDLDFDILLDDWLQDVLAATGDQDEAR